jgi:hypothetical protein
MEWYLILVLVVASPAMFLAGAYVWFLTLRGIYSIAREARELRAATGSPAHESSSPARQIEQSPGIPPKEKVYLVCERCSRTIDIGKDGPYPKAVFLRGYCDRCARFLEKRTASGENDRRLEGTVLLRGSQGSGLRELWPTRS